MKIKSKPIIRPDKCLEAGYKFHVAKLKCFGNESDLSNSCSQWPEYFNSAILILLVERFGIRIR